MAGQVKPAMWCPGIVPVGHPLRNGLVGLWPMWAGSGSGAMDVSGHGHDGSLVNNAAWASGPSGHVIDLPGGTDRVDFSATITPPTYTQFTFMVRTRIDVIETAALAGKGIVEEFGGGCRNDGQFYWYVGNVNVSWTSNAGFWVAGEWATVVIIYNGTLPNADKVKVYKDGAFVVPSVQGVTTTSCTRNANPLSLGYDQDAVDTYGWNYWNGKFECAALWDRALSASEAVSVSANPNALITMPDEWPKWVGATSVGAAAVTGNPWWYYHMNKMRRAC